MSEQYLYRVHIVADPEWEERECFKIREVVGVDANGREFTLKEEDRFTSAVPKGWIPMQDYVDRFNTNAFIEPSTTKLYQSRSGAKARAELLESFGYKAIVQRSAPLVWPEGDSTTVEATKIKEVFAAIKTLVKHGVVKSADELL